MKTRKALADKEPRERDALSEATRRVIEDEIRRGETPPDVEPDQKREPGSRI
jgi:hypothetical protein